MKTKWMLAILILALALVSCAQELQTPAPSGCVTVETSKGRKSFTSLEMAFDSVEKGESATIYVNEDIVLKSQITVENKRITLTDSGDAVVITRDFSTVGANRMFFIKGDGYLTVKGSNSGSITIDGSLSSPDESLVDRNVFYVGDGAADTEATLELSTDAVIRNNKTSAKGGAALVNGKLILRGAKVLDNSTTDNGGAFQISYNAEFKMYSGTIRNNSANHGGGVNLARDTTVQISGGSFIGNTAVSGGGNLYIPTSSQGVTISGGFFSGGKYGEKDNDIGIANKATVKVNGVFSCENIEIRGKETRIELNAALGNTKFKVTTTAEMTGEERAALFTGTNPKEYGAFKFQGLQGSMFNDNEHAHIKFFASPVDYKEWGDCTYIEFPDGANMLVDCAQYSDDCQTGGAIAKELWALGIEKIDICLLTHYHSDHANGFKAIFEEAKISVGQFISSPYMPESGYSWLEKDLKTYGGTKKLVSAGSEFKLGGSTFQVLWPDKDQLTPVPRETTTDAGKAYTDDDPPALGGSLDMNSKGLVVMMKYGSSKVLFTGDIYANKIAYKNWDYTAYDNKNSEEYLVKKYKGTDTLNADIMTAPHHGKRTSSSEALIAAVSPAYAIAMGGNYDAGNCVQGSETKHLSARYTEAGAVFYLTGSTAKSCKNALNKNVYVELTGGGYIVTADGN